MSCTLRSFTHQNSLTCNYKRRTLINKCTRITTKSFIITYRWLEDSIRAGSWSLLGTLTCPTRILWISTTLAFKWNKMKFMSKMHRFEKFPLVLGTVLSRWKLTCWAHVAPKHKWIQKCTKNINKNYTLSVLVVDPHHEILKPFFHGQFLKNRSVKC